MTKLPRNQSSTKEGSRRLRLGITQPGYIMQNPKRLSKDGRTSSSSPKRQFRNAAIPLQKKARSDTVGAILGRRRAATVAGRPVDRGDKRETAGK